MNAYKTESNRQVRNNGTNKPIPTGQEGDKNCDKQTKKTR